MFINLIFRYFDLIVTISYMPIVSIQKCIAIFCKTIEDLYIDIHIGIKSNQYNTGKNTFNLSNTNFQFMNP